MGIRRKKIPDSLKEKIIESLDTETPRTICDRYKGTSKQISLSEIYKIRREKQGQQAKKSPSIPSKDIISFVRDWRTRVRFLSLGELLERYWFGDLHQKLQYVLTEFGSTGKRFDAVQGHHAQSVVGPIRIMLGLENSQAFIELRQLFPGHSVWTAGDQWGKNYGEYIEGLSAWCSQIRTTLVDGILDIINFGNEKSRASVEVNLAFVGTVVSCDSLLREIKERPPRPLWYLEAENLRQVRANAISRSSTATKKFLSSEYNFDSIWERKIAIPSTGNLLDKLEMLDVTSNHLQSALAELELHVTPH